MYAELDGFLCRRIQKKVDRIQEITGVTKYRLSSWIAISAGFCMLTFDLLMLHFNPFDLTLDFLMVCYLVAVVRENETHEREFLTKGMMRIPIVGRPGIGARVGMLIVAVLYLTIMFYLAHEVKIPHMFASASFFLFPLFGYIDACVPRRPTKSKVRQVCEEILSLLDRALGRELVPVRS